MKTVAYPAGVMKKIASGGVILSNLVRKQGNVFLIPFEEHQLQVSNLFSCTVHHHPECAGIYLLLACFLRLSKTRPLKALDCQVKWMVHRKASSALLSVWLTMSSRVHVLLFLFLFFITDNSVAEHLSLKQ